MLAIGALIIALYIRMRMALMFAWTFYAASVGLPALAALYWRKTCVRENYSKVLFPALLA